MLTKLLNRCQEFFTLKLTIVNLLREVHFREQTLEALKKFIADLDEAKDNKKLERNRSKKSQTLYSMVREVEDVTS